MTSNQPMNPIMVLRRGAVSLTDRQRLIDNGICVVEADDLADVRFLEPICDRPRIEQASIEFTRRLLNGLEGDGTYVKNSELARIYVGIVTKGTALAKDPPPPREPKEAPTPPAIEPPPLERRREEPAVTPHAAPPASTKGKLPPQEAILALLAKRPLGATAIMDELQDAIETRSASRRGVISSTLSQLRRAGKVEIREGGLHHLPKGVSNGTALAAQKQDPDGAPPPSRPHGNFVPKSVAARPDRVAAERIAALLRRGNDLTVDQIAKELAIDRDVALVALNADEDRFEMNDKGLWFLT